MDEKLTRGALWNKAGTAGIALGAVSAIYLFVTQYLSSLGSSIWISGFSLVLWGIKLLTLANVLVINPDLISQQIDAAMKIAGSSMDSNTINALDKAEAIMPQVIFFSNLIYCFLYGTVLSAILSRNIPPRNPFARRYSHNADSQE